MEKETGNFARKKKGCEGVSVPLVLVSHSPARRILLQKLGIPFTVISPLVRERQRGDPETLVLWNARAKARAGARIIQDAVLIACDTVVVFKGRVIGKPKDANDARRILSQLAGNTHAVLSGLVVYHPRTRKEKWVVVKSYVTLRRLSQRAIERYVATGEPFGKAGAYGIQTRRGRALVSHVRGSESNVIGLPMKALVTLLIDFGIRIPLSHKKFD